MDNKQLFAAQALKDHFMGRIMAADDEGSTVQSEIHLMETGKIFFEIVNLEVVITSLENMLKYF